MHFCDKCDNMLYIKLSSEDSDEIIYYCRNCGENVPLAEENCILRTNLGHTREIHNLFINKFTKLDPTLPRTKSIKCPNESCPANNPEEEPQDSNGNTKEVIYIRYDDDQMKYLYLCSNCDYVWKTSM